MREEAELEEHRRDAQKGEVDIELLLEARNVLADLEQAQQPDQPEKAQEAQQAHLRLLALHHNVDQLDGDARGEVDPEPARHVHLCDLELIVNPLLARLLGRVRDGRLKVEDDVDKEQDGDRLLEVPHDAIGRRLEADAVRHRNRRVDDEHQNVKVPHLLPRIDRQDDAGRVDRLP